MSTVDTCGAISEFFYKVAYPPFPKGWQVGLPLFDYTLEAVQRKLEEDEKKGKSGKIKPSFVNSLYLRPLTELGKKNFKEFLQNNDAMKVFLRTLGMHNG
jgi:hypothetical protein